MKVAEAKELVLGLMLTEAVAGASGLLIDPNSPDGDEGKFVVASKPARVIHHYDGWYVPIDLRWFAGGVNTPMINGTPFYWYAFAIPKRNRYRADHYLLCDYLQVRDWVLDFTAPLGRDHRDHRNWRADLRLYPASPTEHRATSAGVMNHRGSTSAPGACSNWTTYSPSPVRLR
jgi:hypothetical protein